MPRILVSILAVLLVVTGMVAAADLHIEAASGDNVSFELPTDHDKLPDSSGHCGCCCHGSAHYVALPLAEPRVIPLHGMTVPLQNETLLNSLPLAPPTHPPKA